MKKDLVKLAGDIMDKAATPSQLQVLIGNLEVALESAREFQAFGEEAQESSPYQPSEFDLKLKKDVVQGLSGFLTRLKRLQA